MCKWHATYCWKTLDKGYNFSLNLISIVGPNFGNFKTPTWESQDKNAIWMLALWPAIEYTIRGKGGGFPQVWAMVSFVSPSLPMACPSTKSALAMH